MLLSSWYVSKAHALLQHHHTESQAEFEQRADANDPQASELLQQMRAYVSKVQVVLGIASLCHNRHYTDGRGARQRRPPPDVYHA